jgi:hypothetical protein
MTDARKKAEGIAVDGCALGSRIAYNSMTKSFCTCGLDDFRKEK